MEDKGPTPSDLSSRDDKKRKRCCLQEESKKSLWDYDDTSSRHTVIGIETFGGIYGNLCFMLQGCKEAAVENIDTGLTTTKDHRLVFNSIQSFYEWKKNNRQGCLALLEYEIGTYGDMMINNLFVNEKSDRLLSMDTKEKIYDHLFRDLLELCKKKDIMMILVTDDAHNAEPGFWNERYNDPKKHIISVVMAIHGW